jgi:hypothetical protein
LTDEGTVATEPVAAAESSDEDDDDPFAGPDPFAKAAPGNPLYSSKRV